MYDNNCHVYHPLANKKTMYQNYKSVSTLSLSLFMYKSKGNAKGK